MENNIYDSYAANPGGSPGADFTCEALVSAQGLPHTLCVILIVVFIGILLTMTSLFGISAWLGNSGDREDYYDGLNHDDIVLESFSDNLYRSSSVRELLIKYDYLLFRNIPDGNAVLGREGFVFDRWDTVCGYDYIRDYVGEGKPAAAELDALEAGVRGLLARYRDDGRLCFIAVIPNLQTVYSDRMPDYFGRISSDTRLACLTRRLDGEPGWIDLTLPLTEARSRGQVFNNTENSLNALGAYYAYRAVYDALPASEVDGLPPVDADGIKFMLHLTEGKTTAKDLGLADLIRNRTISLSSDFPRHYTVTERIGSVEMVYSDTEYRDRLPLRPALLLQFTSDWDRILMTDYFSGTFGKVGYASFDGFSQRALEVSAASVVVIFVHENEIGMFAE